MTPVRLEPAASRSRVKHSTTEPLDSLTTNISFENRKIKVPLGSLTTNNSFENRKIKVSEILEHLLYYIINIYNVPIQVFKC